MENKNKLGVEINSLNKIKTLSKEKRLKHLNVILIIKIFSININNLQIFFRQLANAVAIETWLF